MTYTVCYDIKGIQQVITSVPRLRYMVGASSLIAQFDLKIAPGLAKDHTGELVDACTCGGGKGTIFVTDEHAARNLRLALIRQAHRMGLDIRIGIGADPNEAWQAQDLLPFVPAVFPGAPCGQSGMYPVQKRDTPPAHHVVRQRFIASSPNRAYRAGIMQASPTDGEPTIDDQMPNDDEIEGDVVGCQILQQMVPDLLSITPAKGVVRALAEPGTDGEHPKIRCRFMRNVSADPADIDAEFES